ncbi:serine hydrolase domain-containing protein [Bailinhaonella thermotolerans]|uniref:Class A beta-lactamase-related serine hydrolase n=1 Tax=Bailinhaonella thermotolerans TaxID=1070861 RepID=A0A3A4ANN0_9ACTN|nr:serine hydrolase domain-containing protein [Bailinhaonella thermotolerans]RJL20834.1 class A beta-lactamase-related serine hydrolase [Bailinhaonella thermotolerans]
MFRKHPSPPRTRRLAAAGLAGLLAGALAFAVAPEPPRLGPSVTGDAALAQSVRDAAGPEGHLGLSVALAENGTVRTAGLGSAGGDRPVTPATRFEIGSVTKTFTGMLLAGMAAKDGLDPRSPVPGLRRSITYEELAAHRSGLPRLAPGFGTVARSAVARFTHGNPYRGEDAAAVRRGAREARLSGRGKVAYSNLGMAVLGHALAERAGMPYPDLLKGRLLEPLGMRETGVWPPSGDRARGFTEAGHEEDPWIGDGYAPAGVGLWSTSGDLARLAVAVLRGTAPGAAAATPRFTESETTRVGYGWFTTRTARGEVTWHNGGTGGFSSYVGLDPATGRAVVVLGNTTKGVEYIGLRLLGHDAPARSAGAGAVLPIAVTVFFLLMAAVPPVEFALRRKVSPVRPAPDRLGLLSTTAGAVFALLLAWLVGAWETMPPAIFALTAAITAAAAALALSRWPGLPTARTRTRRITATLGLLVYAALTTALLLAN